MQMSELLEERERLSADDEATRTTERFLADALARQERAARHAPAGQPGRCSNCGSACLPTAVYCDADCRDDDERRRRAARRNPGRHEE